MGRDVFGFGPEENDCPEIFLRCASTRKSQLVLEFSMSAPASLVILRIGTAVDQKSKMFLVPPS